MSFSQSLDFSGANRKGTAKGKSSMFILSEWKNVYSRHWKCKSGYEEEVAKHPNPKPVSILKTANEMKPFQKAEAAVRSNLLQRQHRVPPTSQKHLNATGQHKINIQFVICTHVEKTKGILPFWRS